MRLPPTKNWGEELYKKDRSLTRQLDSMYTEIAREVNRAPQIFVTEDNNPPSDSQINSEFEIGDEYIRKDTDEVWKLTSRTSRTAVTWTKVV